MSQRHKVIRTQADCVPLQLNFPTTGRLYALNLHYLYNRSLDQLRKFSKMKGKATIISLNPQGAIISVNKPAMMATQAIEAWTTSSSVAKLTDADKKAIKKVIIESNNIIRYYPI